ncbi:MAG: PilZ domain-containing protein [Planctomycetota bacterium]
MSKGVELSERRLDELVEAIYGKDPDDGQRRSPRVRTSESVLVLPFDNSGAKRSLVAEVWDLSREGIAVLLDMELTKGSSFDIKVPRDGKRDLEMLCEVRHVRPHTDGRYLTGAVFGASWFTSMAAMMQPPPLASGKRGKDAPVARHVRSRVVDP